MFDIRVLPTAGLVDVKLGGLMTVDEVAAYIAALRQAFLTHRLTAYAMIIDVSDCPIQTQEMIGAMGRHMGDMPKARAIAVVTGSSLARMQARRLFTQPYARIVAHYADARSWVLDGIEPPAPRVAAAG